MCLCVSEVNDDHKTTDEQEEGEAFLLKDTVWSEVITAVKANLDQLEVCHPSIRANPNNSFKA